MILLLLQYHTPALPQIHLYNNILMTHSTYQCTSLPLYWTHYHIKSTFISFCAYHTYISPISSTYSKMQKWACPKSNKWLWRLIITWKLKDLTTDISKMLYSLYLELGFTSPQYDHHGEQKKLWRTFIDWLMGEWKYFLCKFDMDTILFFSNRTPFFRAILTTLQIQSAVNDAVTMFTVLLSMMCVLSSRG